MKNKEVNYSKGQLLFLDAVMQRKNIFLKGKAGTGKSFITIEAIRILESQGRNVAVVAPTGVAANNVKGQTIHSMFQINPFGVATFQTCGFFKALKRLMMEHIDTLIIDEVSMLRADVLDAINWTLLKNGCAGLGKMQVIFVGDMKQLSVVVDDNTRSVLLETYNGVDFTCAKVYQSLNVLNVDLNDVLRQSDPEFIDNLNLIRDGAKSVPYFKKFIGTKTRGVILAPHNDTVQYYNTRGLDSLPGKVYSFTAEIDGKAKLADYNLDSVINVKDGASIMYLVNNPQKSLVNGTLGIFRQREGLFFIEVDGVQREIQRTKFSKFAYELNTQTKKLELVELGSVVQMPIKLAYAVTIHKSQGLTFDEVTIDLTRPTFGSGMLYVALSRVRTPEGLTIITGGR